MGTVFDLLRCSVHDGPGLRTVIYFKGCSLACVWCHNPEGISFKPQLRLFGDRCTRCGRCAAVCPLHTVTQTGHAFDAAACKACGKCADACFNDALALCGYNASAQQLAAEAAKDIVYYRRTGGGVTLSGGEVFCQPAFARDVLAACKQRGLHTAVESALNVPYTSIAPALDHIDLFIFDIKLASPEKHRLYCGCDNALILDNAAKIAANGKRIWIRTPLIPGVNDSEQELSAIAAIVRTLCPEKAELLRYNELGEGKRGSLMKPAAYHGTPQSDEDFSRLRALYARLTGIKG